MRSNPKLKVIGCFEDAWVVFILGAGTLVAGPMGQLAPICADHFLRQQSEEGIDGVALVSAE